MKNTSLFQVIFLGRVKDMTNLRDVIFTVQFYGGYLRIRRTFVCACVCVCVCVCVCIMNLNTIQIKSRLKSGNICYHSMQNLSSSSLISKNIKIKIHITIILHVVSYGCKT